MRARLERLERLVEGRAAARRARIAAALAEAGIADVTVEGEAVRATGRGLVVRWLGDLALRDAGRDDAGRSGA